ncbi:hypothetical protein EH183_31700 [Streptomyces sp. CB01881]|nr:hypothetical protein C2142_31635 [Streptomyces sp. CB01881]TYC70428.1 hypothetical protein EH183_31700 [Streptomyces sp. CB01881]
MGRDRRPLRPGAPPRGRGGAPGRGVAPVNGGVGFRLNPPAWRPPPATARRRGRAPAARAAGSSRRG